MSINGVIKTTPSCFVTVSWCTYIIDWALYLPRPNLSDSIIMIQSTFPRNFPSYENSLAQGRPVHDGIWGNCSLPTHGTEIFRTRTKFNYSLFTKIKSWVKKYLPFINFFNIKSWYRIREAHYSFSVIYLTILTIEVSTKLSLFFSTKSSLFNIFTLYGILFNIFTHNGMRSP